MPKKRNTSWSRNKKEKQIITSRLMEISLKVDDCIYNHMPISVGDAEQYIKEVSSYKLQCSGDERSLQVIEKLTRCMKAIILDHQELGTVNHTMQNATSMEDAGDLTGSISPVYSIPDEDRTQFTQITEAGAINVIVADQDVEIIDLSNIDGDDLMYNDTRSTTTDYASSRITVEVDIHREMSSLSLKDAGDPLNITASDVNCSQSILNNFDGIEKIRQNEINIISHETVIGGLIGNEASKGITVDTMQAGNTTFGQKPNKNIVSIIKTSTALNKGKIPALADTNKQMNTDQNKEPLKEINSNNFHEKEKTKLSHTFYSTTNNITGTQSRWYDSNRTCTINDSSHTLKHANNITQPSQIYKVVNPDPVKNKTNSNSVKTKTLNAVGKENQPFAASDNLIRLLPITTENSIITKKKRGPRKKIIDENEAKPKTRKVYRAPKKNKENTTANTEKNKVIPIYNENVINDLSWIENIRYVREITADENDLKLDLEESFWENCYLPANWSESEFL